MWNAAEKYAIEQHIGDKKQQVYVKEIRQALKLANLPMRCDAGQLTSWAARYRKTKGKARSSTQGTSKLQSFK